MRFSLFLVFFIAVAAQAVGALAAEELCRPIDFEDMQFTVCTIDTRIDTVRLYATDENGSAIGSFAALQGLLANEGQELIFGMNAGMYDEDLKPIGLFIENGRRVKKVNTRDGYGNFHLKPNGVFYVAGHEAGVLETSAFLKSGIKPDFASQSGPMLVIDGTIHPKFGQASQSFKRRNGVGAIDEHTLVFAISEGSVTFHAFARFFRDQLGARNALFLDGTISSLHYGNRSDGFYPLGPIVAVSRPQ